MRQQSQINCTTSYLSSGPNKISTTKRNAANHLKSKIAYFRQKSTFFLNELQNLKIEKTITTLQIKKLRLELKELERNNP